ncbi:IS21-like element helper ATPase IstB [Thermosipho ferrireducens]|uniref:IS21-like element helper ATPase IstB n=1 Tax=Thermosipho ferrireducens TaxID=2571116 RepID=A0ABX7S9U1_9BACT|nr:IS21-like element helper ATPase IstB [Thermosipho ferrireducens]QTA37363.1 IS21-like element helper ATPase IstB [Thermosipho ferrireducens]QTA37558.1 IS21-like element helper ATPase IstB [Thermosipho ferrireducens]QTA37762.1 IS21-like element helper ATPase IstB [Thermosipho ferrireducens]QTA38461.1 IS21-like element helper ATPase IstB [Thermosipho ferrireducens]QTA38660.1 IS21-like element helper ATPase IstB [Thermosipho ferrireducens]
MNVYIKLQNNLEELNLVNMKNNLDKYITLINNEEKSIVEALYELSELELKAKRKRAIASMVKVANFPFLKGIEDFDFDFQPGINKQQILDLKSLRFVENNENILFVGTPGVGKTHLAVSLGIECAKHRYSTYFIHFQELIAQLKKALKENRLEVRLKHFAKYKVLIIDEIGYLPIDKDGANIFFQLISKRYEKHSTIITTNTPFSEWSEIFGSPVLAQAILDRLLHHSHVISIKGESYRLKEKLEFFSNSSKQ